jgi:hypothetical protein
MYYVSRIGAEHAPRTGIQMAASVADACARNSGAAHLPWSELCLSKNARSPLQHVIFGNTNCFLERVMLRTYLNLSAIMIRRCGGEMADD